MGLGYDSFAHPVQGGGEVVDESAGEFDVAARDSFVHLAGGGDLGAQIPPGEIVWVVPTRARFHLGGESETVDGLEPSSRDPTSLREVVRKLVDQASRCSGEVAGRVERGAGHRSI